MVGSKRRLAALAVAVGMLAACGQHAGIHVDGPVAGAPTGGGPDPQVGDAGGEFDDAFAADLPDGLAPDDLADPTPDGSTPGTAGPSGSAPTGGSRGGGGSSGGGGSAGGGDTSTSERGQGSGRRQPRGQDRTGVTDDTITIAVHAPITGAAPLPNQSFLNSRDLYWRWLFEEKGETVLGRTNVEVLFADDKFDPSAAVAVCRQLAARAFALVGGGGTDQVQACGRFAGQARVPYFSPGVFETGLENNPWYFAASMTYKQQAPLLAQYVRRHYSDKKIAGLAMQAGNLDEAVASWESSLQGLDYHGSLRHPRGDTAWYNTFARELGQAGVEVLFIGTSPLDYIRFAQTARDQGYDFQYVGVGVTLGINAILNSGCPAVDRGVFFSPMPSLEVIDDLDPEFRRAARRFDVEVDDFALALWSLAKFQHELLDRYGAVYGNDLTREDFRDLVESTGPIRTGVFPEVRFTPDDHFGGTGVHVLRADCSTGTYRDAGTFKSSF